MIGEIEIKGILVLILDEKIKFELNPKRTKKLFQIVLAIAVSMPLLNSPLGGESVW